MFNIYFCCCCCNMRTGGLGVGWISAVASAFNVVKAVLLFVYLSDLGFYLDALSAACTQSSECAQPINSAAATGIVVIFLMANLVGIILSALLIYGIDKNLPHLVIPYMVHTAVCIALVLIIAIVIHVSLVQSSMPMLVAPEIIITGVLLSIMIYFLLVVRSCYNEMMIGQSRAVLPMQVMDRC